jgi:hypothetical protein
MVCPLFGALTTQKQQRVFESAPRGIRKIVLCTNIAETSVTVPDIKYAPILYYYSFALFVSSFSVIVLVSSRCIVAQVEVCGRLWHGEVSGVQSSHRHGRLGHCAYFQGPSSAGTSFLTPFPLSIQNLFFLL